LKTAFIYTENFMKYDLGKNHPLKPVRLKKTYDMIIKYDLLDFYVEGKPASEEDLSLAHSKEYIEAVKTGKDLEIYGFGTVDNPVFDNMFESSLYYVGASIQCADYHRAFNISGGLHHAKRNKASGFCVFNDCVILIKKLLQKYRRIGYIDIDAHHGDGVQEAFYSDPRVLFVSMHEAGKFLFPGTGDTAEIGTGEGKGTTVNIPLAPFTSDDIYLDMFERIVIPIMEEFKPELIVTQLGIDAHYLDPLSHLSLSLKGYREILIRMEKLSERWIGLGGGGYNIETVPRAWTLAYSIMRKKEIDFSKIWEEEVAEIKKYESLIQNARSFAESTYRSLKAEISEYFSI